MANEKDLSMIRFKKENSYDINSEITLEDYKTDIKKLLCCKETVSAPSKYVSKNGIELEGSVSYSILYLGADDHLYSTVYTEEYALSATADAEICGDNLKELTSVRSDGVTVRLLSPRKFSIKNRICSRTVLTGSFEKEDCLTERFVPSECESQLSLLKCVSTIPFDGDIIELCDEYIPRSDSERIISADAAVFISDVHSDDGRVSVRGELIADVLACDDTGFEIPYVVRRKIPFSQEAEHPDVKKGDRISANGICTELKVQPEESRVLISAYCSIGYLFMEDASEHVCTDAFSPLHNVRLDENNLRYISDAFTSNGNISLSTSLPLTDAGVSPSSSALTAIGNARVTELSFNPDSGKCAILGECRFKAIFFNDANDTPEYEAKDILLPFRYEFPYEAFGTPELYCQPPTLSGISLRSDGEKLALDCELSLAFTVVCEDEMKVVSDVTVGAEQRTDDCCIRIVYPQKGETLWSLAKKTSSRVSSICERNGFKPEDASDKGSLALCKFVII